MEPEKKSSYGEHAPIPKYSAFSCFWEGFCVPEMLYFLHIRIKDADILNPPQILYLN